MSRGSPQNQFRPARGRDTDRLRDFLRMQKRQPVGRLSRCEHLTIRLTDVHSPQPQAKVSSATHQTTFCEISYLSQEASSSELVSTGQARLETWTRIVERNEASARCLAATGAQDALWLQPSSAKSKRLHRCSSLKRLSCEGGLRDCSWAWTL